MFYTNWQCGYAYRINV